MSWSALRKRCTCGVMQEAAFQLPEGREQPHPAADHLIEGREDCPPAAAPRAAAQDHLTRDAGRQRGPLTPPLMPPIIAIQTIILCFISSISPTSSTPSPRSHNITHAHPSTNTPHSSTPPKRTGSTLPQANLKKSEGGRARTRRTKTMIMITTTGDSWSPSSRICRASSRDAGIQSLIFE